MALNITKGIQRRPQKVVIYGSEGIGKTTLASKFPEPLFIDLETGSSLLDVNRIEDIKNWTQLGSTIAEIIKEKNICKTIIIDTADAAQRLCYESTCDENGWDTIEKPGYGKGYAVASTKFASLLSTVDYAIKAGINVVFIAHAQMRKFEQPDEMGSYDRWELKLHKLIAPQLKEWADLLLFCNYKTNVIVGADGKAKASGAKRMMYADHDAVYDAKNRHGLPKEMEMDYENIKHIFE